MTANKTSSSASPIIIANWKMNPSSVGTAKKLFLDIRKGLKKIPNFQAVIVPPTPFITELRKLSIGKQTTVGAQDADMFTEGPHTGGVSAAMLASLGVTHVIVGHSERRAGGETDEMANEKIKRVLKEKMTAVLCVGEHTRDASGGFYTFVETQITKALVGIPRTQLAALVIAYEPVWAISSGDGKGQTATPEHAHEMKLFIQKVLTNMYGRKAGFSVPVLYGGSVNPKNAEELFVKGEVDGFLIGGASLDASAFISIITTVVKHS